MLASHDIPPPPSCIYSPRGSRTHLICGSSAPRCLTSLSNRRDDGPDLSGRFRLVPRCAGRSISLIIFRLRTLNRSRPAGQSVAKADRIGVGLMRLCFRRGTLRWEGNESFLLELHISAINTSPLGDPLANYGHQWSLIAASLPTGLSFNRFGCPSSSSSGLSRRAVVVVVAVSVVVGSGSRRNNIRAR